MRIGQYSKPLLSEILVRKEMLTRYGLKTKYCILLGHLRSSIYLVTTIANNYIFKLYSSNFHQLESILGEVELLDHVYTGARVSFPIADRFDIKVQRYTYNSEMCYGVLYSYANGDPTDIMNDNQMHNFGIEMAKFHLLTLGLQLNHELPKYSVDNIIDVPLHNIKPAFRAIKEEYAYLTAVCNKASVQLKKLEETKIDYGYVHFDLGKNNIHIDENENPTFFDFDIAGKAYVIFDVFSIRVSLFNLERLGKIRSSQADSSWELFLMAYQEIRTLDANQLRYLSYFGVAYLIFGIDLIYRNFEAYSYQNYLKDRLSLIHLWVERHKIDFAGIPDKNH